ncbi:MAG TPA: Flp pilus assembly protein CpaB [Alphaproteobacteria bacterium]|jgi:pilus assembly protein CpaB
MNPRTILLVLVALSLAGGTALFARNWVQSQRPAVAAKPAAPVFEGKEVLVAKQNLPAGTFVKPDHLRWQPWPEQNVAQSYLVKGKGDMNSFVGAVVRQGIAVGEPVTDGRVVKPGDRGFLAAVLDPGMRAVSVAVNAETGISGLVFPGDRVDLLVAHTMKITSGNVSATRRAGETVLTKIRVIAIDQKTDDQSGKPGVSKTVTLEVTPKQAEAVAVAAELGKLSLSLRSLGASEEEQYEVERDRGHTWDTEVSRVVGSELKGGHEVEVVHGAKSETVIIGGGGQGAQQGGPQ